MSSKSNDQGRAYEYICLITLEKEISKKRPVKVDKGKGYRASLAGWGQLTKEEQGVYTTSAEAAVAKLFELEPLILNDVENDVLELSIQPDRSGKIGDVRDIIIRRKEMEWELGLSVKHNHFAVKHSRLSSKLDFGKSWFGVECSMLYWKEVTPVFTFLNEEKKKGTAFHDLPNKEETIYKPVLLAFVEEMKRLYATHREIPAKLIQYLLGQYDFYKVISVDRENLTKIQGFNLHGTLNKPSKKEKSAIEVPLVRLPTRIIEIGLVPGSDNTVELYLDNGWQFTFRIHNARTIAEPSLKFDIQIVGMPTAILTINCIWK
jgi:hypothetical protein